MWLQHIEIQTKDEDLRELLEWLRRIAVPVAKVREATHG